MKKKYRNKLPKGVRIKQTCTYVENGDLVAEVEFEDAFQPKDGDFLVSSVGNIFIYSDEKPQRDDYYCCYCGEYDGNSSIFTHFSNMWTCKHGCRYATTKEKDIFLERLKKECGKRWNSEKKELEIIRWRAHDGEPYYYIDSSGNVRVDTDYYTFADNERYEVGNYCRFEDKLVPYAKQVKEIYKKLK